MTSMSNQSGNECRAAVAVMHSYNMSKPSGLRGRRVWPRLHVYVERGCLREPNHHALRVHLRRRGHTAATAPHRTAPPHRPAAPAPGRAFAFRVRAVLQVRGIRVIIAP